MNAKLNLINKREIKKVDIDLHEFILLLKVYYQINDGVLSIAEAKFFGSFLDEVSFTFGFNSNTEAYALLIETNHEAVLAMTKKQI
jgi:hypothetical protein